MQISLPAYLSSTTPALGYGFEDAAAGWTVTVGTVADHTTAHQFSQGTQGIRQALTSGTAASANIALASPFTVGSSGGTHIGIDVYVDPAGGTPSASRGITLTLYNTFATTKAFLSPATNTYRIGWNRIMWARSAFTANNSPSWDSPIVHVRVSYDGGAADRAVVWDNLQYNITPQSVVLLLLHQAGVAHYTTLYPVCQARGIKGTLIEDASGTSAVGQTNMFTVANLQEMFRAGWTVTKFLEQDHGNLTLHADQAAMETEIAAARDALITQLVTGALTAGEQTTMTRTLTDYGVYPLGDTGMNITAVNAAAATGNLLCHASGETNTALPYGDLLQMGCDAVSGQAIGTLTGEVTTAKNAGRSIWYTIHSNDITGANLGTLLDHCIAQQVPCITMDDWYQLATGNAVSMQVPWGDGSKRLGQSQRRHLY